MIGRPQQKVGDRSGLEKADKIWMDGKVVDWNDAHVHLVSNTLHYGFGVFEGIRCYKTESGPAVFQAEGASGPAAPLGQNSRI